MRVLAPSLGMSVSEPPPLSIMYSMAILRLWVNSMWRWMEPSDSSVKDSGSLRYLSASALLLHFMRTKPSERPKDSKPRMGVAYGCSSRPASVSLRSQVSSASPGTWSGKSWGSWMALEAFERPMMSTSSSDLTFMMSRSGLALATSSACSRSSSDRKVCTTQKPFVASCCAICWPKARSASMPMGHARSKPPSSAAGGLYSSKQPFGTQARRPSKVCTAYSFASSS
mmetsp:Transcript_57890/g.148910  ORF Transcript_57890/g.148910 Transcript_57890/m.148910 type:complete len:227 (+) Transcript_57890:2962-3642(+)